MDKEKIILDTMKKLDKELKSGEIAEATGIDKKDVSKILTKLKKEGKIESPKRCYYRAK